MRNRRTGALYVVRAPLNARAPLGDLGTAAWVPGAIQTGGQVGGGIAAGVIGGAAGGPIGAGIGFVASLIAKIFGAHAAKEKREDQISGAWAASGPQAIDAVMAAYKAGQISASDAKAGLASIQAQFYQMTQPITKFNGQFGSFPDPEGPRPPKNCNWACGTSWDLNAQIQKLNSEIDAGTGNALGGLHLGGLDPTTLALLVALAFLFL